MTLPAEIATVPGEGVVTTYVHPPPQLVPVAANAAAEPEALFNKTTPDDAVRTPDVLIVIVQLEQELRMTNRPKESPGLADENVMVFAAAEAFPVLKAAASGIAITSAVRFNHSPRKRQRKKLVKCN